MSQTVQDKEANMDKKEIADEEREKMLNEENTKHMEPVNIESEGEEQKPKRKIPIGGIKMPGFCRTKSKELGKEDGIKTSESTADTATEALTPKEDNNSTPAINETKKDGKLNLLNAIRLPIVTAVSSFPTLKRNKQQNADAEMGTVGLTNNETPESGTTDDKNQFNDEGMETVRLDGNVDNNDDQQPSKKYPLYEFIEAIKNNRFITGAVVGIFLLAIIIISIACTGPQRIIVMPLKDGKYMEAVTHCGRVQGILEDGGFAFRGIPYAVPPIGINRWRPAESMHRIQQCWNGTYLAYNSSNMCIQRDTNGNIYGNEDCLYLDVFTPQVRYDTPLPVVVMIGAETMSGGSPGILQPSAKLAKVRDMVFVRPNFRMGIFGFLAAKPLSKSTHLPTSGNYGLSDIVAVLKWVQLNIQHFGGDKSAVTVWGHRAGGTLVTSLLAASKAINVINHSHPKGSELFSRAWISSPSIVLPTKELYEVENLAEPFLRTLGCSDALCLRNKTTKDIMDAVPSNWYASDSTLPESQEATNNDDNNNNNNNNNNKKKHEWLVLDGVILQENLYDILKQNDGSKIRIVMGTTAHSAIPLRFKDTNLTMNNSQIEKIVKESLLGTIGVADEALKRYNSTIKGLAGMISDIRVVCPLYNLTSVLLSRNISFYVATQARDGNIADSDSDAAAILGSYLLKTPEAKRHQSAIQQFFNQFVWHNRIIDAASSSNPNNRNRRVIVVGQDVLPEYEYPNCDFWIKKNIVPKYARID